MVCEPRWASNFHVENVTVNSHYFQNLVRGSGVGKNIVLGATICDETVAW